MDEPIDPKIVSRLELFLEQKDKQVDDAMLKLYGVLPRWFPKAVQDHAKLILLRVFNEGVTVDFVVSQVRKRTQAEILIPGVVSEPISFCRNICELKRIWDAVKPRTSRAKPRTSRVKIKETEG